MFIFIKPKQNTELTFRLLMLLDFQYNYTFSDSIFYYSILSFFVSEVWMIASVRLRLMKCLFSPEPKTLFHYHEKSLNSQIKALLRLTSVHIIDGLLANSSWMTWSLPITVTLPTACRRWGNRTFIFFSIFLRTLNFFNPKMTFWKDLHLITGKIRPCEAQCSWKDLI